MKKSIAIIIGLLFAFLVTGCRVAKEPEEMSLFSGEKIVGKDIGIDDITDFYYTVENINYDAYYQRYRFYAEDGKHMFFHETRERKDDYGPCTEDDATLKGTIELTDDQWTGFFDLINGGTVKAREESADAGDDGPWLFLYWTNDKDKYQQFSFDSYGTQKEFVDFCLSLVPQSEKNTSRSGEEDMTPMPFLMVNVGETIFSIDLSNNSSAEEFLDKVNQGGLTVDMYDYGDFEKVGDLPWDLPTNDEEITTVPGDVILYQGNKITIYYDENTWNFTKLGHINATPEEIREAFGGKDDITAEFFVEWTE